MRLRLSRASTGLVDTHHFRTPVDALDNLSRIGNHLRLHAQVAVRDDFVTGIAVVDGGLEHLHAFAGDHGPAQTPDQLFALARKHGAADYFDPTDITGDYVHTNRSGWHS